MHSFKFLQINLGPPVTIYFLLPYLYTTTSPIGGEVRTSSDGVVGVFLIKYILIILPDTYPHPSEVAGKSVSMFLSLFSSPLENCQMCLVHVSVTRIPYSMKVNLKRSFLFPLMVGYVLFWSCIIDFFAFQQHWRLWQKRHSFKYRMWSNNTFNLKGIISSAYDEFCE